jgi:hypothetical protein
MEYTKEEFKRLWESNDNGGGITFDDIADCAKAWGLYSTPKIHNIAKVTKSVTDAANCETDNE